MKEIRMNINDLFTKDLLFTVINYFIRLILKPIILLGIPFFLTEFEQGYWYTFGSLAALTTFADLGFTTIITQFSAHELSSSHGEINENIISLFRFVVKWISVAIGITIPIIMIIGAFIFNKKDEFSIWGAPWFLYCLTTGVNFIIQAVLSFFEGLNKISVVQHIKSIDAIVINLSGILFLAFGKGIYSLGLAMLLANIIDIIFIIKNFKDYLKIILRNKGSNRKWLYEIIPLLSRYAISWICGYLIFQIYNPLVFYLHGAELAGKVGYSITIISSIGSISNIWIYVVIPKFNVLAEEKNWDKMDKELKIRLPLCIVTFLTGVILFSILLKIPIIGNIIGNRILGIYQIIILSLAYVGQIIINGIAVYLRAHKKEPLMPISVFNAFYSLIGTILGIYLIGIEGIFIGYASSFIIAIPLSFIILFRCKKKWHIVERN